MASTPIRYQLLPDSKEYWELDSHGSVIRGDLGFPLPFPSKVMDHYFDHPTKILFTQDAVKKSSYKTVIIGLSVEQIVATLKVLTKKFGKEPNCIYFTTNYFEKHEKITMVADYT